MVFYQKRFASLWIVFLASLVTALVLFTFPYSRDRVQVYQSGLLVSEKLPQLNFAVVFAPDDVSSKRNLHRVRSEPTNPFLEIVPSKKHSLDLIDFEFLPPVKIDFPVK